MRVNTKKTKGFILIEILVSLLVLSAGILFLVKSLSMITKSNSQIRNNRLAYIVIDNIYNRLYSGDTIQPAKILIDQKEFSWDYTITNPAEKLKNIIVKVTWGAENSYSSASLSHSAIDLQQ